MKILHEKMMLFSIKSKDFFCFVICFLTCDQVDVLKSVFLGVHSHRETSDPLPLTVFPFPLSQ